MKRYPHLLLASLLLTTGLWGQKTDKSGAEIFMNYCSACHGKNLEGGQAPSLLTDKWKYGSTKKAITHTIKKGVPNTTMVAWENMLTEKEIKSLAKYMFSLKKKRP